jgi:CRP-like cAMP-binding protein
MDIHDTLLFRALTREECAAALELLQARGRRYPKGSLVLRAGSATEQMGLLLSGALTIESNDVWGSRTILSHVGPGEFFAESYALLPSEPLLVDVAATQDSRVLLLRICELEHLSPEAAPWASKLLRSLLEISVKKNLALSQRSFHTSPKTVRGRVTAYLSAVSLRKGSGEFDIPFDRQEMADYLNLDRTALSKELGKMQREGILEFRKNHFVLKV